MKTNNIFTIVLVLLLAGMVNKSEAQLMVGGNLNAGLPSGTLAKSVGPGFGLNIDGRYQVAEQIMVGAQLGYEMWGEKNKSGVKVSSIPFLLSGDYLLASDGLKPYVGVMLGYASSKATITVPVLGAVDTKSSGLGYGVRAGVLYPLSDKLNFNASLGYKSYAISGGNMGQINVNLGVLMNLEL